MTRRALDVITKIRADLRAAERNNDYGDGDLGRGVTAGTLDLADIATDRLPALLDLAEAALRLRLPAAPRDWTREQVAFVDARDRFEVVYGDEP
jgi:hypothetical protein